MSLQISIRDEKPAEPQPVMKLWLEQDGDDVVLRGEDGAGTKWYIARINSEGIRLTGGIVASTSSWPLDDEGRLKLINY